MELYLENLKVIDSLNIFFTPGLNIITGKNGSGKSTICSSFYLGLYGSLPNLKGNKLFVKKGESNAVIDLKFQFENNDINVRRIIGKTPDFKIYVNNELKHIDFNDILDSDYFKYVYFLDTNKLDIFNFIDIEPLINNAKEVKKEYENLLNDINNKIIVNESKINQNNENLDKFNKQINALKEKLNMILITKEKQLRDRLLVNNINDLLEIQDLLNQCKIEYDKELLNQENELKIKIKDKENEKIILENKIKEQKQQLEFLNKELNNEIHNIEISQKIKEKEIIDSKLSEINNKIIFIKQDIKRLEDLKNLNVNKCPICNNPLDLKHLEKELNSKQNEYKDLIKKYNQEKENIIEEIKEETNNKINEIKNKYTKEINNINKIIENFQKKYNSVINEINNFKLGIDDKFKQELAQNIKYKILGKDKMNWNSKLIKEQLEIFNELSNIEKEKEAINLKINEYQQFINELNISNNKLNKQIENYEKEKEKVINILSILNKFSTKPVKSYITNKLAKIVENICSEITKNFPISIIPELRESNDNYTLVFNATNLHNEIIPIELLSQGESTLAKIAINLIIRKFLTLVKKDLTLPNILILDELLDRLDSNNAIMVLEYLQSLTDYYVIVVTHRSDIIDSVTSNVITLE